MVAEAKAKKEAEDNAKEVPSQIGILENNRWFQSILKENENLTADFIRLKTTVESQEES